MDTTYPVFDKPLGSFFRDPEVKVVGPLRMAVEYSGGEYACTFPTGLISFIDQWVPPDIVDRLTFHVTELPSGRYGFFMRGFGLLGGDTLLWVYRNRPEFLN